MEKFKFSPGRRKVLGLAVGTTLAASLAACGADGQTPSTGPSVDASRTVSAVDAEAALNQQIANYFGVGRYSKLGTSWERVTQGESAKATTVHLKDGPKHTRVKTNGTTIDGYIKVLKPQGVDNNNPSITLVVNGDALDQVDLVGGTFRKIVGEDAGVTRSRVWQQKSAEEPVKQPGTLLYPVGFRPEGCGVQSTNVTIRTAGEAAARFGADDYSNKAENWKVVEYDDSIAFELKVDDSGLTHRVQNLTGTFFEGYMDIDADGVDGLFNDGVRALTMVGNGSAVKKADGRGFSIYAPKGETSANELNRRTIHLLDQVTTKEHGPVANGGQPGVIILPLGFNPTQVNVC